MSVSPADFAESVRVSRRQMVLRHHLAALRVLLLLRVPSYQMEIIACFIKTVKETRYSSPLIISLASTTILD
jgi:hypothetical protein